MFHADEILLKCPSKYIDENGIQRDMPGAKSGDYIDTETLKDKCQPPMEEIKYLHESLIYGQLGKFLTIFSFVFYFSFSKLYCFKTKDAWEQLGTLSIRLNFFSAFHCCFAIYHANNAFV